MKAKILVISLILLSAQQIIGGSDKSAKETDWSALRKLILPDKIIEAETKEVLQGLQGVLVLVEDIIPEVEKYGLTKRDIQTDTELQLRQYGIRVFTLKEQILNRPYFYVNVNVLVRDILPDTSLASASISVTLKEPVILPRQQAICVGASTWRRSCVVRVGAYRIKEIREDVKDLVSQFINDYLAANPKETKAKSKNNK